MAFHIAVVIIFIRSSHNSNQIHHSYQRYFFYRNSNKTQETPESLLRSALQGKGYAKGIQNSVTVIPSINSIKSEGNLRRAIFSNDAQVNCVIE